MPLPDMKGAIPGGAGVTARPGMGMPPPPPGMGPGAGAGGPTPSPMATPQPNEGLKASARVNVQIARQMLELELPKFGSDSEEGKAILAALTTISRAFGKTEDKSRELIPSETMNLLGSVGPGAGTPGQKAMAGAPAIPGAGGPPPIPGAGMAPPPGP